MLVISRKKGQQIQIAEDLVVTVLAVKGKNVRLGIDAPKSIPIRRREVYEPAHMLAPHKPDLEPMKVAEG